MRFQLKFLIGSALSMFLLNCYAITVQVQVVKPGEEIRAFGFTVAGKRSGERCSTCDGQRCCVSSKSGLPAGEYSFGLRLNSLIGGDDVSCLVKAGTATTPVTKDSSVVLIYNKSTNACRAMVRGIKK